MADTLYVTTYETPDELWHTNGDTRMFQAYLMEEETPVDVAGTVKVPEAVRVKYPVENVINYSDVSVNQRFKYNRIADYLRPMVPSYKRVIIHSSKSVFLMRFLPLVKDNPKVHFYYFMHNPPENLTFTYYHDEEIKAILREPNFHMICVSDNHAQRVKWVLKDDTVPLKVIKNGIPLNPEEESHSESDKPYTGLYVGRLDLAKNALEAIQVLINLSKETGKKSLVIGNFSKAFGASTKGSAYEKEYLQKISDTLVGNPYLQWIVSATSKDVLNYMKLSDVLVTMSSIETFGLIVAEANSVGTPVLGVDSGGIGELITNGVNGYKSPSYRVRMSNKVSNLCKYYYEAVKINPKSIQNYAFKNFNIKESHKKLWEFIKEVEQ